MPRDGNPARLRLQQAAIDLYDQHGFDQVTIAEIAARAGVTERTFYRHFADKREVLFDGETNLRAQLVAAVAEAPSDLEPLGVLQHAYLAAVPLLEGNRRLSEPLRRIIAATPSLVERQQAKTAAITDALAGGLRERGVSASTASLTARIGMAVFSHVATTWFAQPELSLDQLVRDTFADLHSLTAAPAALSGAPSAHP